MNLSDLTIRAEAASDEAAVRHVVQAAFADGTETSDFVENVRKQTNVCLAEVVTENNSVVAHAQYIAIPLTIDGRPIRAAYLACLSVLPSHQGSGVGSMLVRHGLDALRKQGFEAALVLGSPRYYPRVGFSSELARKIRTPHNRRGDAFMAVELVADALQGRGGRAEFPDLIVPSFQHASLKTMEIAVRLEPDPARKREIQERLTALLPDWFGKRESNAKYAAQAEALDGYVGEVDTVPCGLLLLNKITPKSAEIYWMGVDPSFHGAGIGTALMEAAVADAKKAGVKHLFVATLHPSDTYEPYQRTRRFYESVGFGFVLEEQFPADPENPTAYYLREL